MHLLLFRFVHLHEMILRLSQSDTPTSLLICSLARDDSQVHSVIHLLLSWFVHWYEMILKFHLLLFWFVNLYDMIPRFPSSFTPASLPVGCTDFTVLLTLDDRPWDGNYTDPESEQFRILDKEVTDDVSIRSPGNMLWHYLMACLHQQEPKFDREFVDFISCIIRNITKSHSEKDSCWPWQLRSLCLLGFYWIILILAKRKIKNKGKNVNFFTPLYFK